MHDSRRTDRVASGINYGGKLLTDTKRVPLMSWDK